MTLSGKPIRGMLRNTKGFTIIELAVVMAMIFTLSSIAISNFIPLRKKALDATALTDARHLVDTIIDATLNDDDVDYDKDWAGGPVGDKDTAGNPRPPVFNLSNGVEAKITGTSNEPFPGGSNTIVTAIVYHSQGTSDGATLSGKKEFIVSIDESTGLISLP